MPRAVTSEEGLVQYFLAALSALKRAHSEVLALEAGASELCGLVSAWGEGEEEVRRPGLKRKGW